MTKRLLIVSDDSVKHGFASYCVVVELQANNQQASQKEIYDSIWCNPQNIKSYREEIACIAELLTTHGYRPDLIVCDNKGGVEKLNSNKYIHPLALEWDILTPVRRIIKSNDIS